jgi:hypothetical protein
LQNALVFKAFLWRRTARPGVKDGLDGSSNSPAASQSLTPSLYETLNLADEAVFTAPRNRPETHPWFDWVDQTRGSIMLVLFLNAIYGRFLDAALPGMAIQGATRWPR